MKKGRILKVRPGHEANCSSGMIALIVLMGSAVTLLPASLIVAGIQAGGLGRGKSPPGRARYWIIPVGLGIVATVAAVLWVMDSGHSTSYLVPFVLSLGGAFILSCLVGYVLAPRMNHPGWLVLIAPLILAGGSAVSVFVSATLALVAVGSGLVITVVYGLAEPIP
jgi:hypothetical protein